VGSISKRPSARPAAKLLVEGVRVVNVGVDRFSESLRAGDPAVACVDWRPPGSTSEVAAALARLSEPPRSACVDAANNRVVRRLLAARPWLVDVRPARVVIPALRGRALLHAGPPLRWDQMTGPMQGAALGAVMYEGWVDDLPAAERLLANGAVELMPCHDVGAVGPMGGITSGNMPLLVVEEREFGGRAYCTLNEGIGRVLRFGANGPDVLERLRWLGDSAGPLLGAALASGDGIDLRSLIARALTMGDEMHQRNVAATALLLRELAPAVETVAASASDRAQLFRFVAATEQFFLNVAMAACKAIADAAAGDAGGSTLVTAMSRNGFEFGIKVGATGERWLTAPVNVPSGLFFGGYSQEDANPDIGDSAITETVGVGAFCMAAAPAVVPYIGAGGYDAARRITTEMWEITAARNPDFAIPSLDFAGAPTGIDVRLVVATGITPIINTGIAHRQPGVGQIGAGTVRASLACFEQALLALDEQIAIEPAR
jgi:hypothetical protein